MLTLRVLLSAQEIQRGDRPPLRVSMARVSRVSELLMRFSIGDVAEMIRDPMLVESLLEPAVQTVTPKEGRSRRPRGSLSLC